MLIYWYVVVKVVLISGMEKHIMPSVVQHFLYNIGVRNISDSLSCDDGLFFIYIPINNSITHWKYTNTSIWNLPRHHWHPHCITSMHGCYQAKVFLHQKKVVKKAQKIDETKGQRIKHGWKTLQKIGWSSSQGYWGLHFWLSSSCGWCCGLSSLPFYSPI